MTSKQQDHSGVWTLIKWSLAVFVLTTVLPSGGFAQSSQIMVGIAPLVSKLADIPAEEAQELFINALMETNQFAILPPGANGSYVGSTYVFEPTISEGKAKSNVLGFLKDVATSNTPINLTVRVFDSRTNALLKTVTVKSTETSTAKVSSGDVQSLMGLVGAGKSEQSANEEKPDHSAQLEERLGGLMQQTASRLAAQLGAPTGGVQRPGMRR